MYNEAQGLLLNFVFKGSPGGTLRDDMGYHDYNWDQLHERQAPFLLYDFFGLPASALFHSYKEKESQEGDIVLLTFLFCYVVKTYEY